MSREFVNIRKLPITRKTIYFTLLFWLLVPTCMTLFWGLNVLAFLAASIGGICGWFLLQLWEKKMQNSVAQLLQSRLEKINEPLNVSNEAQIYYENEIERLTTQFEKARIGYEHQINLLQSSVAKSKDEVHQMHLEMDKKLEEMRGAYLEFEDLRQTLRRFEQETALQQEDNEKNLKHKDSLLAEYQKTISEQRMIIEKKQRYIAKLEGKVRDLMYEIRSLLQLESANSDTLGQGLDTTQQAIIDSFLMQAPLTHSPYDFSVQLQKYIEKAENLTGVNHLGYIGGNSPRFLDLSLESYAVDRRRLFDHFNDESLGIVFIYSPPERKFLFVNHMVKSLIGWSPEKFMKEFPRLVVQGYSDWVEALSKIKMQKESSLRMAIQNKAGQSRPFECYMGLLSKGPFADHVIGLLH